MARLHEKPAKPYGDFPLFAHGSGQWAKKIRGRMYYFGVWNDPAAACEKYLRERDFLQAGVDVPDEKEDVTTLRDLCNHFLTSKQNRLEAGELSRGAFTDYKRSCDLVLATFGKMRLAGSITPSDFVQLRGVVSGKYGPVRTGKEITHIRMLFRWGQQQELIGAPRFGSEFVRPSKDVLRRHRQASPPKMFEAEEIRAMLKLASVHAKAWLLLGINAAFIQKDLSDLTLSAVSLGEGMIDFPRQKTAIERRIPLWAETVTALANSLAVRNQPSHRADQDAFFITQQGNRLVRMHDNGVRVDAVRGSIDRLQARLQIKQKNRSFSALRHTFRTIADETTDLPAIMRVMGHTDHTISEHYRERIADSRMVAVVTYVRNWLFEASRG